MARRWHYSNRCNTAGNPEHQDDFHKILTVDVYLVCQVDRDHLTAEEAGGRRGVIGVRLWDFAWGPRSGPPHPHPPALDNAMQGLICHCNWSLPTWMTTGATAVTRPPAAGRRRRPPPGAGARVKGRRLETTMREDEVSDMLPLRLSETTESISNKFSFQTHDVSGRNTCEVYNFKSHVPINHSLGFF